MAYWKEKDPSRSPSGESCDVPEVEALMAFIRKFCVPFLLHANEKSYEVVSEPSMSHRGAAILW